MISLIIKSYLVILLSVGIGAILLFSLGMYLIFRYFYGSNNAAEIPDNNISTIILQPAVTDTHTPDIHAHELASIAGEDLVATQLDLARAYMEIDNHPAAIKLLESISQQGNDLQKNEAIKLLNHIADLQFVQHIKHTSR